MEDHLDLAAIARVDEAGRIHLPEPVPRSEARAGHHEPRITRRDRDCDPGSDDRARAGRELDALARGEVEAGIARVRPRRDDRVRPQTLDGELHHGGRAVSRAPRDPATR